MGERAPEAAESVSAKHQQLRNARLDRIRRNRRLAVLAIVLAFGVGFFAPHLIFSMIGQWFDGLSEGAGDRMRLPIAVPLLAGLVLAATTAVKLLGPSRYESALRKGTIGEKEVGRILGGIRAADVVVLHDRRMPGSRANLDHVVVSRAGIFTVETKRYLGKLEVRASGKELWIAGRNRSKLLSQALSQRDAIARLLHEIGAVHVPVTPVLCFVDTTVPLLAAKEVAGVRLTTAHKLRKLLDAGEVAMLDELRVAELGAFLDSRLPSAMPQVKPVFTPDERAPVAQAVAETADTGTASIPCTQCGRPMVERRNRQTGEGFLGCSGYPTCRNTLALTD